jgi:FkbM family methyltransferase
MFYRVVSAYTRQFSFPYRGLKYFLKLAKWLNIADRSYKKKLHGGFFMHLNPTEHIQQQLFWYGYYEKELGDLIKKALKPGDVFLDIGANIGYFALLAATKDPAVRVVAFEPVKDLFEHLKENIKANNIKNTIAVNAALGEISEEKEIFIAGPDNLGMSSFRQPANFSGKKEKVKILRVDDWFKTFGLSKVDLVKIDAEGSELAVIKGMKQVLEHFKPLLVVEVNPETLALFDLRPNDVFDNLDQLGYGAFLISKNDLVEITGRQINHTINALFVHRDRKALYDQLFN